MTHFFKTNDLPYNQIDKIVRFAEMKYDWSHDDALAWYKQYGDEMMRQFPLKKGAREVINRLYDTSVTLESSDCHFALVCCRYRKAGTRLVEGS